MKESTHEENRNRRLVGRSEDRQGHDLHAKRRAQGERPYGFNTRFGDTPGTNPEELLGAAHAGCFTMALSNILAEAGMVAQRLDTKAEVTLDKADGGFAITAVHLTVEAVIPGASAQAFEDAARKAETGCPVSKVLKAKITMDARLKA